MASLTRAEATARAALVEVTAYRLDLDLDSGEDTFESTSRVRFTCRQPGASTFVDVKPSALRSVTLNGRPIDPATLADERIVLDDLAADNELVVTATMAYVRDGQGLHRSVDSADGFHYVYAQLFLDSAPRVFACFDQPDLKARYDVHVTAPPGWIVLGNGAATRTSEREWTLATTEPLATYFVTVCAGPYVSVRTEHDGIPMGLHARASLREPLERQAEQMFEVTRAGFDYYHELFGIRYPFGDYHQVFVTEFNAGAMENPGCVTIRDPYLFRGAATDEEILTRSNTIAHELAHMWFGDLVTMRWWDDLWLNESFAEYMSHRTLTAATDFTDAWVDFSVARKSWGYGAERTPSTHPVAGSPAPDAISALQNFDGISYAKGASALRQLIAYLGDDAFVAGVRDYLKEHSYSNADLGDFLAAMEQASGKPLAAWSKAWLRTAGLDTIAVEVASEADVITIAVALRTPPDAFPADRPHLLDVAGFTEGKELWRVAVTLDSQDATLPELTGATKPRLVVPNAADLTWAKVELDGDTLDALPTELALVPDALARAVVWNALVDGVALAEIDPRLLLEVFAAAWPAETSGSIAWRVAQRASGRVIREFLPPEEQDQAWKVVADAASRLLAVSPRGSTLALTGARFVARCSADLELLQRWAAGEDLPEGLDGDSEFRWLVLTNLAARGEVTVADLDAALAADNTMQGNLDALLARASRPTADAKTWAWEQLTGRHGRSNYELISLADGFWEAPDPSLVRDHVPRFFQDLPALSAWVADDALSRVVLGAYPRRFVEMETLELTEATLARTDLTPGVRRALVDSASNLREALASRAMFD